MKLRLLISLILILGLVSCEKTSPTDNLYTKNIYPGIYGNYTIGSLEYPYKSIYLSEGVYINGNPLTPGGGSGDMTKAVYDPNDDGVIATAQLDPTVITESDITVSCYVPVATGGMPLGGYPNYSTTVNSATTGRFYKFSLPFKIIVNQIVIKTGSTVTTPGTIMYGVYSEDGQIQYLGAQSPTLSSTSTFYAITLASPVTLQPGNYYGVYMGVSTTNLTLNCVHNCYPGASHLNGRAPLEGYKNGLTSGTLPATFDPTTITSSTQSSLFIRLDN